MDFCYIIDDNFTMSPEIFTDYEEAKKNFFLYIRYDIKDNAPDEATEKAELAKLEEYISHFEDRKLGEEDAIKTYVVGKSQSSCRVMITAWDGKVGWSPLTCEAFAICRDRDEVEDFVSFNAELWSEVIIPAGLKVVKTENVYDEESDEEPESRVNGDWFVIRNDVYLTDGELVAELKRLGIIEFVNQYGE